MAPGASFTVVDNHNHHFCRFLSDSPMLQGLWGAPFGKGTCWLTGAAEGLPRYMWGLPALYMGYIYIYEVIGWGVSSGGPSQELWKRRKFREPKKSRFW